MIEQSSTTVRPAEAARWQRLEALFHRALDLPEATRVTAAKEWCHDQPELLSELLEMLDADSSVDRLLASGALPASPLLKRPEAAIEAIDPWLGRVLGPFLVERELGRGGMGVVYFGRRVAGGFTQHVAVKLIARHLHAGPAVSQFILERDTLARLAHPNIARLLDAGVTPEGTPYVAMEYIEGRRLDHVCDDPEMPLRGKVALMLQLCEAVAYVHRNLILHRDLKPANVMVTAEGAVKLLDFGTLKLLGTAAQLDSEMTQAGMRAITLRYASPEHIQGDALTTASDVYSLGMILYRLLAGKLPGSGEDLALSEHLRRLKHDTMPPPSPRSSPQAGLAGDLDAIALKATRFEAAARYPSADALADDLRRALRHIPVSAATGARRYRIGRFLRRHRTLAAGALASALVLAAGVAAMAHQASVARAQSRRADAGVETERKLAHMLLFDYFEQLKRIPASTDAQRKAVVEALHYLDSLDQASVSPAVRLDSIRAYTDMGLLQGSLYEANLGDVPGAIVTLRKAVLLAQRLRDEQPGNLDVLGSYVSAQRALGQVYFSASDSKEALSHLLAAADAGQHMIAKPPVSSEMIMQVASTSDLLGDLYGMPSAATLNDPVNALARYRQAEAAYRTGLRLHPDCAICLRGVAVEDYKLGMTASTGAAAEAFYRDALDSLVRMPPAEQATPRLHRMGSMIRQSLGLTLMNNGQADEGLGLVLSAEEYFRGVVQADPVDFRARGDLALLGQNLANTFADLGRTQEEGWANQEFLVNTDAILRKDPTNALWQFRRSMALARSAELLAQTGNVTEATRQARESIAIIVPLALKPEAHARVLGLASDSLVKFHLDPPRDAPMALSFAQRSVAGSQIPTAEQLLTLAEAQRFANDADAARNSAQAVIKTLDAHPEGAAENALKTRAIALQQSLPAH